MRELFARNALACTLLLALAASFAQNGTPGLIRWMEGAPNATSEVKDETKIEGLKTDHVHIFVSLADLRETEYTDCGCRCRITANRPSTSIPSPLSCSKATNPFALKFLTKQRMQFKGSARPNPRNCPLRIVWLWLRASARLLTRKCRCRRTWPPSRPGRHSGSARMLSNQGHWPQVRKSRAPLSSEKARSQWTISCVCRLAVKSSSSLSALRTRSDLTTNPNVSLATSTMQGVLGVANSRG
jgi:hypothetical protein